MPLFFDPMYLLFAAPAFLLGLWAQWKVKHTYAEAQQVPAPMSGAQAARHILDTWGLHGVDVEQTQGFLSDHYDPSAKVLRLSPDVYHGRSAAAVGIAAHEAGHALQDAEHYSLLVIRNSVVPLASIGSGAAIWLIIIGLALSMGPLALVGIGLFTVFVFFQLVNLPVEYDASARAKRQLVELGITNPQQQEYVRKMLSAAALTYVAATLAAVSQLLYFLLIAASRRQ